MKTLSIEKCIKVRRFATQMKAISGLLTAVSFFMMYGCAGRIDYYAAEGLIDGSETTAAAAAVVFCILMATFGYATYKLAQFTDWLGEVIHKRQLVTKQRIETITCAQRRVEMNTDVAVQ